MESTVFIVHTCGSCKISISSLRNIVVIDKFDLHIFQFTTFCGCSLAVNRQRFWFKSAEGHGLKFHPTD